MYLFIEFLYENKYRGTHFSVFNAFVLPQRKFFNKSLGNVFFLIRQLQHHVGNAQTGFL